MKLITLILVDLVNFFVCLEYNDEPLGIVIFSWKWGVNTQCHRGRQIMAKSITKESFIIVLLTVL